MMTILIGSSACRLSDRKRRPGDKYDRVSTFAGDKSVQNLNRSCHTNIQESADWCRGRHETRPLKRAPETGILAGHGMIVRLDSPRAPGRGPGIPPVKYEGSGHCSLNMMQ